MGDRLVFIRTADLGADKQASYLEIPVETNPLMGNRGIRLSLDRKNLFKPRSVPFTVRAGMAIWG